MEDLVINLNEDDYDSFESKNVNIESYDLIKFGCWDGEISQEFDNQTPYKHGHQIFLKHQTEISSEHKVNQELSTEQLQTMQSLQFDIKDIQL